VVRTDAVVVGAGPNGLAAAITLAREGVRVTVLEAAHEPGGGTRTYEDPEVPGLLHDHCAAIHPLGAASPFLRSLPLDRYGLVWKHPEVAVAHPFDDGSAGVIHRDLDATIRGLGEDGPVWDRLFRHPTRHFDALASDLLGPVLRVPRHPVVTGRTGTASLLPATVLTRALRTGAGKALFGGIAGHAIQPLDRPLTSAIGLLMGAAGHAHGWPVAEGGSASIWRAMVAMLEDLGGEVVCGERIRAFRDLPRSRVALFDLAPHQLVEIAGSHLPRHARRRSERWRYGAASFKVDFAVRGGVPWRSPEAARAGTLHLIGSFDELVASEQAVADGRLPALPFVLAGQQYLADPTRRAGDVVPLWAYAHVPRGYRGDATARSRRRSNASRPGSGNASSPGTRPRRRTSRRTTRPGAAATSPAGPPTRSSSSRGRGSRPTRTRPGSRASTCARPPRRRVPASTGCAATTPHGPPVGCSTADAVSGHAAATRAGQDGRRLGRGPAGSSAQVVDQPARVRKTTRLSS
jgi:phytoene dehydrogenase-like protein